MSLHPNVEAKILARSPNADMNQIRANAERAIASLGQRERFASFESMHQTHALEQIEKNQPEKYPKTKNKMVMKEINRRLANGSIIKTNGKFTEVNANDKCGIRQIDEHISELCGCPKTCNE